MPTVKRDKDGYNVVSKRWGKFCTHQVSPEGEEFLRDRYGPIDGLAIDHDTFFELKRRNMIYVRRVPAPKPSPRATVAPSPFPQQTVIEVVLCQECGRKSPVGAKFCDKCGRPFVMGPSRPQAPVVEKPTAPHGTLFFVIVLLLVLIGMIVYLGWFRN
jgi:hypothetical protein